MQCPCYTAGILGNTVICLLKIFRTDICRVLTILIRTTGRVSNCWPVGRLYLALSFVRVLFISCLIQNSEVPNSRHVPCFQLMVNLLIASLLTVSLLFLLLKLLLFFHTVSLDDRLILPLHISLCDIYLCDINLWDLLLWNILL
jgi:hypothetical protein